MILSARGMPRPSILLVVAVLALAVAGCPTRRNPDFCCSDQASCRASGTDVEPVTCDDPVKSYCDDNGAYGAPRTCIPDPSSSECDAPADCTNPDRPFCIGNRCVECEDGSTCDNPAPACNATTHLCGPCMGPADCTGDPGGPQCMLGACVECAGPADCPTSSEPVCDATDHTCRGCRADDECASQVCDRSTGTCTPEADVLYVAAGATGTTCTRAQPCPTITQALALAGTSRTLRVAAGTYSESLVVTGARTIRIHGEGATFGGGGTRLQPGGLNMDVVAVSTGASVTLDDVFITGASGALPPNAVRCTNGTVKVRRSIIDNNPGGGIGITTCDFELVNDIITRNGGAASFFGGVSLTNLGPGTTLRFEFVTIAANLAQAGNVAGVACNSLAVAVPIRSSIVYGNDVGAPEIGLDNDCVATFSVIGDPSPGATNTSANPNLAADFHLPAGSSAIDFADPAATLDHDLDRDRRPLGPGDPPLADSGADERVP